MAEDVTKAEVKLSITSFCTIDEFNYCIIQIVENRYKKWIVKLKEKDGEIIASEISQILD